MLEQIWRVPHTKQGKNSCHYVDKQFELLLNRVLVPSLDYYQQKQTVAYAYIGQVISDHVPV
jgi:hypothetical protein